MTESLPLSALLSRALVAFTIELDNAWESRTPQRTTLFGGPPGAVYATSLACWSNFMRSVPEQGVSVAELEGRVRARLALDGMRRWRYVTIAPERAKARRRDWLITPTTAGLHAQSVWRGLPEEIEQRWAERFGVGAVTGMREDLEALVRGLGLTDLPQWLTGHYGGWAGQELEFVRGTPAAAQAEWPLPLSALLSQVLQGFALEYEADSPAALKRRFIAVGSDPAAGRFRLARLLRRGLAAQSLYRERPAELEAGWRRRAGDAPLRRLRATLEAIVTAPPGERAPVWQGSTRRPRAGAAGSLRPRCFRTSRCRASPVIPTVPEVIAPPNRT